MHFHTHFHTTDVPAWAQALDHKLTTILNNQEKIMTTLAEFQAKMDTLKADVAAQTDEVKSATTLINGLVAQVKTLSDQIAALQAAGIAVMTQDQLDNIAAEASGIVTTTEANTAALAAADASGTAPAAAPTADPLAALTA